MIPYFIDLVIVAALIISITALNGVLSNTIGEKLFGGKQRNIFKDATEKTQQGWKSVGGNNQ
ncbi:MAG: hypothetical protein ACI35P_04940 [Bacillus sp. (in: firmicutes)]